MNNNWLFVSTSNDDAGADEEHGGDGAKKVPKSLSIIEEVPYLIVILMNMTSVISSTSTSSSSCVNFLSTTAGVLVSLFSCLSILS